MVYNELSKGRQIELNPEEMLKHIEEELLKFRATFGFHFMDKFLDEIKKYNEGIKK